VNKEGRFHMESRRGVSRGAEGYFSYSDSIRGGEEFGGGRLRRIQGGGKRCEKRGERGLREKACRQSGLELCEPRSVGPHGPVGGGENFGRQVGGGGAQTKTKKRGREWVDVRG